MMIGHLMDTVLIGMSMKKGKSFVSIDFIRSSRSKEIADLEQRVLKVRLDYIDALFFISI